MYIFERDDATAREHRRSNSLHLSGAAALAFFAAIAAAQPVKALIIKPIYDSSITSLPNAAAIEAAFNTVASQFSAALSAPVVIKIGVSWGSVGGHSIGGYIGASLDPLEGAFSYSQIANALGAASAVNPADTNLATVVANLPTIDPTGTGSFEIPYAEAQALGLLHPTIPLNSGYVGFSNTANFDFNPSDGVPKGTFDFQGVAAHEISEVLGRITGLARSGTTWAAPFDALRYSAPGTTSFAYSSAAYLSIDGGRTSLGNFNYTGGGDRSDWASGGLRDAQNASGGGGVLPISLADWTALDALGWNVVNLASPGHILDPGPGGYALDEFGVPEPAAWSLMLVGFGLMGAQGRSRRREGLAS